MRVKTMYIAVFSAFLMAAPGARADQPAYAPAGMTLTELLEKHDAAVGTETVKDAADVYEWTFTSGGLSGSERDVYRGKDYRETVVLGPFQTASGRYKGESWEQGENGYTLLKRNFHQRTEANQRALADPSAPASNVTLLGRVAKPVDAYVIRVAPAAGREERRFYDASTLLLVRREVAFLDRTVVSRYSDYRRVNGVLEPSTFEAGDGRPENDEVWHVTKHVAPATIAESELTIPGSRRTVVNFPAGVDHVRLPAHIDDGRIIVRLTMNGRGLDFQLDSGCGSIVLDRAVAQSLGLQLHGRNAQTVAGSFSVARAIVPNVRVGDLAMNDLVIEALPFHYQNDFSTKVVGLLGFDFIAGAVLKIDYAHGTVDAYRTGTELPHDGTELDAVLDDSVPIIKASINGVASERFLLDTGADDVLIFHGFAAAHPGAVEDSSEGKVFERGFNSVSANGVGGQIPLRQTQLRRMRVGVLSFADYMAFITTEKSTAFEGEDTDGLIGSTLLRAFDVYLDYANARVLLVLNEETKRRARKESGT